MESVFSLERKNVNNTENYLVYLTSFLKQESKLTGKNSKNKIGNKIRCSVATKQMKRQNI